MNEAVARSIAHYSHLHQRDRFDEELIEHVERVAARVPAGPARAVAYLHDVLEHTATTMAELEAQGLTDLERAALELLTRRDEESYELHVLRIAHARGPAGELARVVKRADLDDRLGHALVDNAPPYAWARRHVAAA